MISSSSSSSSPDSKSGSGVYTFRLFFYDGVDNASTMKDYSMTNKELLEKLGKLIDTSEEILKVMYYTHPLNWWQMTKINLHHAYVVFKTDQWWWSIEKNNNCVALQRSKTIGFVRDKYYRADRQESLASGISCIKEKTVGSRTVKQFLDHIKSSNYVDQQYNFLTQNCQQMADQIYAIF